MNKQDIDDLIEGKAQRLFESDNMKKLIKFLYSYNNDVPVEKETLLIFREIFKYGFKEGFREGVNWERNEVLL